MAYASPALVMLLVMLLVMVLVLRRSVARWSVSVVIVVVVLRRIEHRVELISVGIELPLGLKRHPMLIEF